MCNEITLTTQQTNSPASAHCNISIVKAYKIRKIMLPEDATSLLHPKGIFNRPQHTNRNNSASFVYCDTSFSPCIRVSINTILFNIELDWRQCSGLNRTFFLTLPFRVLQRHKNVVPATVCVMGLITIQTIGHFQ